MTSWRVTQVDPQLQIIDLGIGQPDFSLLPTKIMAAAAAMALSSKGSFLNYGYEPGDEGLRHGMAEFLTRRTGAASAAADLFITAGASQALDLICTLFTTAGDTVFVEEPSYFLALRILEDHRLNVVGLPLEPDGIDMDALEKHLRRDRPAFVYTIPTFQNPSGVTLSHEKRARLVDLAERYGFLIVADEVYHLLDFGLPPPPPLAAWSPTGRVLSLNSFSKILAPGLRLGWVKSAPEHTGRLAGSGLVDSGGGLNPFAGAIVRHLVAAGQLDAYVDRLREIYGGRRRTMSAALRETLGGQVSFVEPEGGYFFWLGLPAGVSAEALLPAARTHGMGFQPGGKFSSVGGLDDRLRLSFAFYDEDRLREGISRLRPALDGV